MMVLSRLEVKQKVRLPVQSGESEIDLLEDGFLVEQRLKALAKLVENLKYHRLNLHLAISQKQHRFGDRAVDLPAGKNLLHATPVSPLEIKGETFAKCLVERY